MATSELVEFFLRKKTPITRLFRWLDEVALCWRCHFEQLKQGDWNKSPAGSECKTHMYRVKINVKFWSFGAFWICLGQGNVWARHLSSFQFLGFGGPEVQIFWGLLNFWLCCTKWEISQKVQILDFRKVSKMDIWQRFQLYMQLSDKIQGGDNLGYFVAFKVPKRK